MARISTKRLAQLCRRMGSSLQAGIDVRAAWEQEARRGPPRDREQADQIARRVAAGDSVAEAMRDCGDFFPPLTREMVDVGEHTGKVGEVFLRLADQYEHVLRLRRSFLIGVAWPAIELSVAVVVVGLLIWAMGFVSQITGKEPVDVLGIGLVGGRGFMLYTLLVVATATAIALPLAAILQGRVGAAPMQLAMRLPWLGKSLQTAALARLAWSLAMALESGIDARRSIRIALRSTQNPYYTSHMDRVDQIVMSGGEFHEALRATQAFPQDFLNSLETAEVSGTESESLLRLSSAYEEQAATACKVLATVAALATWGIVGVVLISLIFRLIFVIYAPYREAWDFLNNH